LPSEKDRKNCNQIANILRSNDVSCEVFYSPLEYGKQIKQVFRRGISYMLFPSFGEKEKFEIKNL
jgi:histidyl-tRNA synthetase